jgi:adenylate cyclase
MVSLRDFDKAIELLTIVTARAQRENLVWFESDTSLDPLRDDPRYKALIAAAEARLAATPDA